MGTPSVRDAIVQAAEDLFTDHDPTQVSMAALADAAGCSRATLYRHFENRHAVHLACAERQAVRVVTAATRSVVDIPDPVQRATELICQVLAEVRARPTLLAWTRPEHQRDLLDLLLTAPWLARLTSHDGDPGTAEWLLRSLLGLLACPPVDAVSERRLVARFLAPLVTPMPT